MSLGRCLVPALAWAAAAFTACQVGSPQGPRRAVEPRTVLDAVDAVRARSLQRLDAASGVAALAVDAGVHEPPCAPALPVVPPPRFGGPVPMARGDAQRTGRSSYHLPERPPRELWRFVTEGAVVAAPTLAEDGAILFTSHDQHAYALDPDGQLRWKHRTGDFVWSSAALSGSGLAVVGSDDDRLYALRLRDGSLAWTAVPGRCRWAVGRGPEAARCDIEDVTLGPDGTIYVSGDGVHAIGPDGRLRWSFLPPPAGERKRHCSSAPALGLDGSVYAVCLDQLYALNPDGSKRWQFEAPGEFDSAPAVGPDGTLYVGDEARRFLAIDAQGQVRFSFAPGGAVRAAPALRSDGIVLFGAYDGVLYALRSDGSLAWTFATSDSIHSAPLVDADGAVLFGSRDNRLYALSADGQLRWSVLLDDDVDGTPALGPDGTIYVGSDDRALHAFR